MDPQTGDDNTNISGMSDDLQGFLTDWCSDDIDPADVGKMLHSAEGAQYQGWLAGDLRSAYENGALNPEFMVMACNRRFDSPQALGTWLQGVWPLWFDQQFNATPPAGTDSQTGPRA